MQFTDDGKRLVYKQNQRLIVVAVDSGTVVFEKEIGESHRFAISGDGRYLVIMDESDGTIQLLDGEGDLLLTLSQTEVSPVWIELSRTGRWLAICDEEGALRVWNLERLRSELHSGGVWAD